MTSTLRLCAVGATHPGLRRKTNDDAFVCAADLGLLLVADGVGGRAGGDVAARIAVDTVRDAIANPDATWPDDGIEDPDEARARMLAAFASANRRVREHARQHADLEGMATTLVAAQVVPRPGRLLVTHLGDSRAYVQRGCHLERITEDHRLSTDARARARLSPEALLRLPPSALTRVIGAHEGVEPDLRVVELAPGDVILLASDGLSAVVDDEEIAEVMDDLHDLGAIAAALIDLANLRGGPDNVTVAVGRWTRA